MNDEKFMYSNLDIDPIYYFYEPYCFPRCFNYLTKNIMSVNAVNFCVFPV